MKKLTLLMIVLVVLSGCVPKKIESGQSEAKITEIIEPQKQIQDIDSGQSEMRIAEMTDLQKQIQDIDSELSRLIQYHREQINELKLEREILKSKLNVLYKIEQEIQGQK